MSRVSCSRPWAFWQLSQVRWHSRALKLASPKCAMIITRRQSSTSSQYDTCTY